MNTSQPITRPSGKAGTRRPLTPRMRAEIERRKRTRRRVLCVLVCVLLFCAVMLVRSILFYESPVSPAGAEVISLGEREVYVPAPETETPIVEDPIVPVPTVTRPKGMGW